MPVPEHKFGWPCLRLYPYCTVASRQRGVETALFLEILFGRWASRAECTVSRNPPWDLVMMLAEWRRTLDHEQQVASVSSPSPRIWEGCNWG